MKLKECFGYNGENKILPKYSFLEYLLVGYDYWWPLTRTEPVSLKDVVRVGGFWTVPVFYRGI